MTGCLTPPLKWHGGKHYLARRIVALMPPHVHYVEPFAGGLAVLLAKDPEGVSEVVNDLDGDLSNFWKVVKDEAAFARLRRLAEATPFSRVEWEQAGRALARPADPERPDPDHAFAFFVRCRQSLAGRMTTFAPLSKARTRRGMNEQVSAWIGAVEGLPAVHARLRRVYVESVPAADLIRREDSPGTLFYMDPPYLPSTRAAPDAYRCEMTVAGHEELLALVRTLRGKVMLSGYASGLYDAALTGWTRHEFDLPNHAAGGAGKRRMTEVLWCNFGPGKAG